MGIFIEHNKYVVVCDSCEETLGRYKSEEQAKEALEANEWTIEEDEIEEGIECFCTGCKL